MKLKWLKGWRVQFVCLVGWLDRWIILGMWGLFGCRVSVYRGRYRRRVSLRRRHKGSRVRAPGAAASASDWRTGRAAWRGRRAGRVADFRGRNRRLRPRCAATSPPGPSPGSPPCCSCRCCSSLKCTQCKQTIQSPRSLVHKFQWKIRENSIQI